MAKIKIALVQMKMSSDIEKNLTNSIKKIQVAKRRGAKIICLPELFSSKYFCQVEKHKNFDLAEKIDEFILWNPKNEDSSLEGTPTDPRFAYIKYNK